MRPSREDRGGVPDICVGDTDVFHKKRGHQRKAWSSWDHPPLYNPAGASPCSSKPTGGEGAVWLGLKAFGASGT